LATSENDDVILTADPSATAGDDDLDTLLALVNVEKVRTANTRPEVTPP